MKTLGQSMIWIGLLIVVMGVLFYFFSSKLSWFGKLPGDIHIQKQDSFSFYAPLTSMIILSVVLSIIWNLVAKFMR